MKKFSVQLILQPDQFDQLRILQSSFVDVCNAIFPIVQEARCWNRVALHHMVYHRMRERFPELGSQMICNAIYSVCRTSRQLFQHPESKWYLELGSCKPIPKITFKLDFPVFFDRHTLNLKDGKLSIYTLNGRMRFNLPLKEENVSLFEKEKLAEVLLTQKAGNFSLHFYFITSDEMPRNVNDSELLTNQVIINAEEVILES